MLCAAGKVAAAHVRLRGARRRPRPPCSSRTSGPPARRAPSPAPSSTRACCCSASRPRPGGCRSCPPGSASAPTCSGSNPDLRTVRSPYPGPDGGEGEELIAQPAIHLDAALVPPQRGRRAGQRRLPGPDLYFDDLMLEAAEQRFVSRRAGRAHRRPGRRGRRRHPPAHQPAVRRRRGRGARTAPTPPSCDPDYGRDEAFQTRVPRHRQGPRRVGRVPGRVALVPDRGRVPGRPGRPTEEAPDEHRPRS